MALAAITATAQKGDFRKDRAHHFEDFSAEEIAQLKTKKLTLALDLTSAQQSEIQALELQNAKAMKQKMAERKKMKEKNDKEKPSKEERLAFMNERLDRQIAHKAKMKSILSAEQYAKWEKMHAMKQKKARKGMKKMRRHNK